MIKKVIKKLVEFLICVSLMGGVSYVSANAGFIEAKIKFNVGKFSYTMNIP